MSPAHTNFIEKKAAIERFLAAHGNKRTAFHDAVSLSMQAIDASRQFIGLIKDFLAEKDENRKQLLMAEIISRKTNE